jgi:hypothetical protein
MRVCRESRLSVIGTSGQVFALSHSLASSEQKPIVGADDQGCRNRESDGGPAVHKVVAKILGVVYRATGAGVGLRLNQHDRELARLLVRSGGRLTDSLEFELVQRLLSESRNFLARAD